ncbi:MAG: hypothetical protein K0S29_96 [Gammaproteobacteria bacterium]|nr:hypothetical protein [Gammaproteobacteria bacterium]
MVKKKIHIKRVYDPPLKSDGFRLLVDRLWPRGIKDTQYNNAQALQIFFKTWAEP